MRRDARTFQVSGMHCAGCVGKVEAALAELPGMMRVTVSLEPGLARVEFDGDRVSPEAIARAVGSLGYQVEARVGNGRTYDFCAVACREVFAEGPRTVHGERAMHHREAAARRRRVVTGPTTLGTPRVSSMGSGSATAAAAAAASEGTGLAEATDPRGDRRDRPGGKQP